MADFQKQHGLWIKLNAVINVICSEEACTRQIGSLKFIKFFCVVLQYYIYFGGQKYVDLGLGSHRVKCRVSDEFR